MAAVQTECTWGFRVTVGFSDSVVLPYGREVDSNHLSSVIKHLWHRCRLVFRFRQRWGWQTWLLNFSHKLSSKHSGDEKNVDWVTLNYYMQSQQLAQMGSLPIFNQLCGSAFRFYTVKLKGNITSLLPALSGHVAPISDIFLLLHRQPIFMQVPSRNTSLTSSSQSFIDLLHLWFVSQAINRFPDFDGERYWCYMKPEENTADATLGWKNQSELFISSSYWQTRTIHR